MEKLAKTKHLLLVWKKKSTVFNSSIKFLLSFHVVQLQWNFRQNRNEIFKAEPIDFNKGNCERGKKPLPLIWNGNMLETSCQGSCCAIYYISMAGKQWDAEKNNTFISTNYRYFCVMRFEFEILEPAQLDLWKWFYYTETVCGESYPKSLWWNRHCLLNFLFMYICHYLKKC